MITYEARIQAQEPQSFRQEHFDNDLKRKSNKRPKFQMSFYLFFMLGLRIYYREVTVKIDSNQASKSSTLFA